MRLSGRFLRLGIFLVPALAFSVTTCNPPEVEPPGPGTPGEPAVIIAPNRPMEVAGKSYEAGDTYAPPEVEWAASSPGRRALMVRPDGVTERRVSMKAGGLRQIYIGEATSGAGTIAIVSGSYSPIPPGTTVPPVPAGASMLPVAEILARTWECIWCPGEEIMVCGVQPQCAAPGDSIP